MRFFSFIIVLLFPLFSFAQGLEFTLSGKVFNYNTKEIVRDAVVKLIGSDNSSLEVKVNLQGEYYFDSTQIKPGVIYVARAHSPSIKENKPTGSCFVDYMGTRIDTRGLIKSGNISQDLPINPEQETIFIPTISFNKNSFRLDSVARNRLSALAGILKKHPNITLVAVGHSGKDEKKGLYLQRAKEVIAYLISEGKIQSERLTLGGDKTQEKIPTSNYEVTLYL